jgi:hypothetical protein
VHIHQLVFFRRCIVEVRVIAFLGRRMCYIIWELVAFCVDDGMNLYCPLCS